MYAIRSYYDQEDKKNLSNDELIALFKGENFNAEEWAKLYKRAGARFGGVIGWHGSDYKHWDSQISDYNTAKMGPKIDVVGQLFGALRKEGIKTLVSVITSYSIHYTKLYESLEFELASSDCIGGSNRRRFGRGNHLGC